MRLPIEQNTRADASRKQVNQHHCCQLHLTLRCLTSRKMDMDAFTLQVFVDPVASVKYASPLDFLSVGFPPKGMKKMCCVTRTPGSAKYSSH